MPSVTSVTQIPGIMAGHWTSESKGTGCTVILCPRGATGAVDVRGGAPATRETDLLRPEETVDVLHAVVLGGGSAFGLAASCGVADELERRRVGLDVGVTRVPIVSGACLFDLALGDPHDRPTAESGRLAVLDAYERGERPLEQGCVGAGAGCTVGKLAGPARSMRAGLGEAVCQAGDLVCAAVAAVNACGNVVDPTSGLAVAGLLSEDGSRIVSTEELLRSMASSAPLPRTNTTISCVVVNARLTKAQATKVAQMAADAYAHAIRPTHTTNDGDTVFVMATGGLEAPVDVVGSLAVAALEQAIVNGARAAEPSFGLRAARDLL